MDPDIFTIRIIENAETGACKDLTKENNLVFSEEPLITLADISYYQLNKFTFYISKEAADKIFEMERSLGRKPFGIYNYNELLLNGYFYQDYQSSSCDWIVTDPFSVKVKNSLRLEFGYASMIEPPYPDPRKDPLMLEILRKAYKLRD